MDLRDLGILISWVIVALGALYQIGQLRGRYVTREELHGLKESMAKDRQDSLIAHANFTTQERLSQELSKAEGRIEEKLDRLLGETAAINKILYRAVVRLVPEDKQPAE